MKKKIDPLFALSVLVLGLGIFALACSWVPFRSQCSESNIVAKADAVASVTPENFSWGVDSNYAVVHGFGNPVICATAVPAYSLYENLGGSVSVTLSFTGTSAGNYATLNVGVVSAVDSGITGVPGQLCYAVLDSSDYKFFELSYNVQSAYVGEANNWAILNGLGIRFNKLSDYSVYSVPSETVNPYDLFWSVDYSGIESGTQAQWVALLDAFLRPSYDSAVYVLQRALSGQIEQLETDKANLQSQLDLLQSKYDSLLISYLQVQNDYSSLLGSVSCTSLGVLGDYYSLSLIQDSTGAGVDYSYVGPQGVSTVSWVDHELRKFHSTYTYLTGNKRYWYSDTHTPPPQQDTIFIGCMLGLRRNFPAGAVLNISMPEVTTSKAYVGVFDSVRNVIEYKATLSAGTSLSFVLFQNREFTLNDKLVFYFDFDDLNFVETDYFYDIRWQLSVFSLDTQKYYDAGHTAGYTKGQDSMQGAIENARQQGFAEAQKMFDNGNTDYSFFGLISAVIDAPIKAIRGLLNFDILGVNMFSFVTSLFSLAVVLMIVKLLLGTRDVV